MQNKYAPCRGDRRAGWLALWLLIALPGLALAQTPYSITGKVTDPRGEGVPGVSVLLVGTKVGTITDVEGSYAIAANVAAGTYQLTFSSIGYSNITQTLTLGAQTTLTANATLDDQVSSLDEVIVTGTSLGTTRKSLGNYIATVKAEQLSGASTGNLLGALQGKSPGAQIIQNSGDPAGGFSVRLRGVSTVSGSSEPLYIIDGVIINNSTNRVTNVASDYSQGPIEVGTNRMADINPDDIERIEVLNGAAAAAIYGSRANAGVVSIFTKRGKSGKPTITFTTRATVSELRKKLFVTQYPFKFGPGENVLTQELISTYGLGADGKQILDANGKPISVLPTFQTPVNRYDYQDYIFRAGFGTDNNLSIAGGNDQTKYYISAGYLSNQGIVKNTDFTRYGMRINLDHKLTNWFTMSGSLNYVISGANEKPDGNTFFSPIGSMNILPNYFDIQARDANGNIRAIGERGRVNPVSVIEDIKQQQTTSRVIGGLQFKVVPFKNLTLDYNLGIDNTNSFGQTYIPPYAYNVSPGFYGGGSLLDITQNGYASIGSAYNFQINHDANATYQATFLRDFTSTTQLGYSLQYEKFIGSSTESRGFSTTFVQTVNGGATLIVPLGDSRVERTIRGYFLQQNFSYKKHIFLTAAGRVDGSSVFAANNRNFFYPKISGTYVISETDFWANLGIKRAISLLKFRAAYGESGNLTAIGAFSRLNFYNTGSFLGNVTFASGGLLADPNLRPERQRELELGIDVSLLDNRVNLTLNAYNKRVDDLLFTRTIAPTQGFSSLLGNVGALRNRGLEIALNARIFATRGFTWDMTGTFSRNQNEITSQPQPVFTLTNPAGAPTALIVVSSVPIFYGSSYARNVDGSLLLTPGGLPQQDRVNRAADGQPAGDVLNRVIGNPNPLYFWTIVNDFAYKKLSLRVQFDSFYGGQVFNADYRTRESLGVGPLAEQEMRGQLPRGYNVSVRPIQEFRVDNGTFVKLREVSLTYKFGAIAKGMSDLTLSLSGRNLLSFDSYKGYDPETNAGGQSNLSRGIDFGNVPIPRTYQMSITAKF